MPDLLANLRERARGTAARLVLAEGDDPRVVAAAERAAGEGLCRPELVGDAGALVVEQVVHDLA